MTIFIVLLSAFLASASTDGYSCTGSHTINPPADLTKPYYYPEGWTESQEPATYAGGQTCNWKINVPQGMFATVTYYKKTASESGITCLYPNGYEQFIEDQDQNPYIFTSPQFQVNLKVSDDSGEFSFKVVWTKYPGACQVNNQLTDTRASASSPSPCITTYTSPNRVVLVGFSLKDDKYPLLRQSAIYDGDSVNSSYLGNLATARYQIVATGNKLTIHTFGLSAVFNYTLFMGMDTNALGDVQQITGVNPPYDSRFAYYLYLNSEEKVSAIATIGRDPDYLEQIREFPGGANLRVYEEQISDSNLMATINQYNFQKQLPLEVKTSLKIYKLDGGRVYIPMTKNASEANWNTVFDGRFVNVHSLDYRRTSYTQDTFEAFQIAPNSIKLYFKFNMVKFDTQGGPTTLAITIYKDGYTVYSDTFSKNHLPPPNTIKILGDMMTIQYQTHGTYTKGFEVDLVTSRNSN
ncbi:hypothetical protein L5515_007107 [Caenorhabditis briggsae]|uniref:CUB-like domain-containing protein n=1 Tax=Caenorhabditis briggsae TaxID=6238 RepID=A0AAE9JJ00_CAEBR|nr:hypothetical protein L5515_007107 [Caenorhabditis briggsae]